MNIGKSVEIFLTHLLASRVFTGWYLAIFCLTWMVSSSANAFDRVENWGFDQGGGYRMGSFTGEDVELVVTCLESDHSQNNTLLAVGGALGDQWAVRIYSVEDNGSLIIIAQWTGDGEKELPFSTITSMAWVNGSLACGVEYLNGDDMNAGILFLDHENPSDLEFSELEKGNRFHWESITSVKAFGPTILGVLGTKIEERKSSNAFNEIEERKSSNAFNALNLSKDTSAGNFSFKEMLKPTDMLFVNGMLWFCGEVENGGARVSIFNIGGTMMGELTFEKYYMSAMKNSGQNVFITGRKSDSGKNMEDFSLICLQAEPINNSEVSLIIKWESTLENVDGVPPDREVGVSLLPVEDGGVVVSGNFRRYWKLKANNNEGKVALLPPDPSEGVNFEAFLARYSGDGKIEWAQASAVPGDDFAVDLASDGQGGAIFLGNQPIGGGFGPYLSKVQIDGDTNKNVAMVEQQSKEVVIAWEPPKTLRLGEPLGAHYLSARTSAGDEFVYRLNGKEIKPGDKPFFEPSDIELSARLPNQQKEVTRKITGLKGRPYLTITYEQVENEVFFFAELSGLHPDHITDSNMRKELLESVEYELIKGREVRALEGAQLLLDSKFAGQFEISAFFPGNTHYESASRKIFLQARNGKVFKPGEENSDSFTLQVKDLDGWQIPKIVSIGEESFISATQGFGRKRKFKGWMEFSEDDQKLRTARVQSPFSLRTALFVEEDMTLFAKYNFTFAGAAVNGYLAGSTVFLDYNLNGELDEGEPTGLTTSNGGFEIEVSEESILANDTNQNGILDLTEGVIVVLGGMDQASKLSLAISYKAPPSYSVITAVSTLVAEFAEHGFDLSEAETIVSKYLDLPEGIELTTFEPLREIRNQGVKAREFILKSTKLTNVLNEGSRFIKIVSGNRISRIKGANLVVAALKNKILEVEISGRRTAQSLDLSDPNVLLEVLNSAESLSESEVDESGADGAFSTDVSVRGELSLSQPDIAQAGNEQMLNQLVEQIASANNSLDEMADSADLTPEEFKVLASASQSILDDLGDLTSNTLFEEEVDQLVGLSGSEFEQAEEIINNSFQIDSLPEDIGIPTGENGSSASFSQEHLSDLNSGLDINVFAPTLVNKEIIAPSELNDDLLVGTFSAHDPEGEEVIYSIIRGNPDFDLDDVPMLFIQPKSGQIVIQDFDDLTLMTDDLVKPIIRVSDQRGLFSDEEVTLNLSTWTFLAGRLQIPELVLKVPENLPIGTVVHYFDPLDVYGGSIEYLLVSGVGDANNSLFQMDTNGTLRTNVVFDYELNDNLVEIRVQAIDSRFNSAEDFLQIRVTDMIIPSVQTGSAKIVEGRLTLDATLNKFGDNGDNIKLGFLVDRTPIENIQSTSLKMVLSSTESESSYSAKMNLDSTGGYYYYMAFAENEEGVNYGLQQSFLVPKINGGSEWQDGNQVDDYSGWYNSPWLGLYHTQSYPWIYHQNLGWVFVHLESSIGSWLYHQRLGWLWTMPNVFPHLFLSKRNQWVHVNQSTAKTTIYDYQEEEWFEPDTPIRIFAEEESHLGGEVTGYGYYYRWDPVILEAQANANYNFSGWSGDINSMEPHIEFEALRNLKVDASFLVIPSVNSSPNETLKNINNVLNKMEHLSEAEKKRSIAELLIFGTSPTSGLSIKK